MIIKNGRVIDPSRNFDEIVDIVIEEGKILKIGKFDDLAGMDAIDATGLVVAPGLVDVHVHFRDPGQTHKEDIVTGSMAAARGGFTTVVAMANTNPIIDNEEVLIQVLENNKRAVINVKNVAALTKGFKGEELVDMERLFELGAVGFSDDGIPIKHERIILDAMERAKKLDTVLSFHEESPSFIGVAGVNEGIVSEKLGLQGAMSVSEDVMVARDAMLALHTGARVDIQHISSGNSVELVRFAKKLGADINAEATPHHFSLTESAVLEHSTMAKMNPPLRTESDRQRIIEALKDETINIIATDHAPHTDDEKNVEFAKAPSGIIGLETSLSLGITNLVREGHLDLMQLIKLMSTNPSRVYKLSSGTLEIGADADIVIFDENENYKAEHFASKSKNTPFLNQKLYGKVKYTICSGKVVYED